MHLHLFTKENFCTKLLENFSFEAMHLHIHAKFEVVKPLCSLFSFMNGVLYMSGMNRKHGFVRIQLNSENEE